MVLIVGPYFLISKDNPWPGYLAIFPVLGAFLIIQAQRNDSIVTSNVLFQKLGAWSYSIYLWHWPFVVAIYTYSLNELYIYIGIVLSVLLGFLSNKYIEKIKFRNDFSRLFSYLKCKPLYIILIIGIISSGIFFKGGIDSPNRIGASTPKAKFLNKYKQDHKNLKDAYWLKCNTYTSLNKKQTLMTDPTCIESKGVGGVFLWGDSHAEALSLGIRSLLKLSNTPFYQKTSSGCKASLNETFKLKGIFKEACDYSNKLALKSIEKLNPQLVIIAQQNGHNETEWDEINSKLSSFGIENILLIGPVSQWKPSLPKVMIKPKNWHSKDAFINDSGLDLSIIETDLKMKKIDFPTGFEYQSLIDHLCKLENKRYFCRTIIENGELLQVDYGHLSKGGSIFVVNHYLAEKIHNILDLP